MLENEYEVNPQKTTFRFHVIGTYHLEKTLGKFKASKESGIDDIASYFLKIEVPVIYGYLYDILIFRLPLVVFQIAGK